MPTVTHTETYTETAGPALGRCHAWLAHATEATVDTDGGAAPVSRVVPFRHDGLGEKQIWILEP